MVMRQSRRNLIAVVLIASSAVLGSAAWLIGRVDPGLTYGFGSDALGLRTLVLATVRQGGLAWNQGARPGDVVLDADGTETAPGYDPSQDSAAQTLPQSNLDFVSPVDLAKAQANLANHDLNDPVRSVWLGWAPKRLGSSGVALIAGLLLCLMGFLWSRPVIAVSAIPLFVLPAYLTLNAAAIVAVGVLVAGGMLVGAAALAESIEPARLRRWVVLAAAATAAVAAIVGGAAAFTGVERGFGSEMRWVLASATVLVPGLVAARSLGRPAVASQLGRTVGSIEVGVTATLPAFALLPLAVLSDGPVLGNVLVPVVAWVVVVVALRMFALRPMANVASRASAERALVVADSEAERRRIAADIHDDVVQDLTMLVHRLDRDGTAEPAAVIRRSIDRLRAICADLRLPVLDDLGLGPAIHALVAELEPQVDGQIRLELAGEGRLPPDVELAIFRIAQESLANAVKHGRPPIVVRLDVSPGRAELRVDDSGAGVPPEALAGAPPEGHMGLLNMTQRAEEIGAALEIGPRPEGGTRVGLVWVAASPGRRPVARREAAN